MRCPRCPMDVEPILFSAHLAHCSPKRQETDEERDARILEDEANYEPLYTRYEQGQINRGDLKGAINSAKRRAEWARKKEAGNV